jgi:hypothetical protein
MISSTPIIFDWGLLPTLSLAQLPFLLLGLLFNLPQAALALDQRCEMVHSVAQERE